MPINTLRHGILFLHGRFTLCLGRRGLRIMRITLLRLRRVRVILLLMVLHVVGGITTCLLNLLLLLNTHSYELLNTPAFRLGVVVNLKNLKLLRQ
jgi:hypothetical protein